MLTPEQTARYQRSISTSIKIDENFIATPSRHRLKHLYYLVYGMRSRLDPGSD